MYIYIYIYIYIHRGELKSSYDDVTPVVDDIFDQCDPSTAKPTAEVCGLQGELI